MTDLAAQCAEKEIYVFLKYYNITNDQGEKLDFKDHAYMQDVYEDFSPRMAILKAAQITASTCFNLKALWAARNLKLDIIYTLPSSADIQDFVSGKTNRLIANNPILQEWTKDKDSIEQKQVGDNIIYFRGTWTQRAAIAIPADLYISDETDRSKQDIVAQYRTRLQHSKFGWEWYLSNPSAPGVGVDKHWQQSDQKYWMVKCQHCNKEWYISMDNIMYDSSGNPYFGCLKCKKELDRHHGRWVKKYNNRDISGYWISLLMPPLISAKYILDKKKNDSEEQFTNFVLGLPYVGKGNVLTRQAFFQNLTDRVNPLDCRPIIGVDTGVGINTVIGNKHGVYYADKREDYRTVEMALSRWKNAIAVIDQGGDIIGPRKLREKYKNRVFLCFFREDQKNDEIVRWKDDDGTVIVDRNKMIQTVVDELTEQRIPIFGKESEWWDVWTEWSGMYRTTEVKENAPGTIKTIWHKPASGRCDYPFSFVYYRVGVDRFAESHGKFLFPGDDFGFNGYESSPSGKIVMPK